MSSSLMLMIAGFFTLLLNLPLHSFGFLIDAQLRRSSHQNIWMTGDGEGQDIIVTSMDDEVSELKRELMEISKSTNRGFKATNLDRKRARDLIFALEKLNPTAEPAASYYPTDEATTTTTTTTTPTRSKDDDDEDDVGKPSSSSIAGKWNLVYTDAPDITGLDTTRNPFSTTKLGRIGQECNPPYVKNVIEWLRPDWANSLPLSGSTDSRILQKVVTSASATTNKPNIVNLKIAGLEVVAPTTTSTSSSSNSDSLVSRIEKDGLVAGLISTNPIDLKGPLNPPFGQFRILYLDDQFRITLTSQNYVAVNQRCPVDEEWF